MTNAPTQAATAEVNAIDSQARGPLLLILGSGMVWLVISGILSLITSIQLHSPAFFADCSCLTIGRAEALRETSFVYGWAANAGLATALWILGRLGGSPLRGLNWTVVGSLFWNVGIALGMAGIATGDMTSFSLIHLPRYVLPLLVFAYATVAISGVLAWSGRRTDGTYASQWYAVAALVIFPWLLIAAQAVLVWMPLRGALQSVAAGWFAQSAWSLWLAPLALAGAYYVTPKITGKSIGAYESAPLGFWTLIFAGSWTAGRLLVGGPVPVWISTVAVVAYGLLLFHYFVIALNLRGAFCASGDSACFLRWGIASYVVVGLFEFATSFRGIAVGSQFTLLNSALQQLGIYGGVTMFLFATIYYMVPRVAGREWAVPALTKGHRFLVLVGLVTLVGSLAYAGWNQASDLANASVGYADIISHVRPGLLAAAAAQLILLAGNLLLLVNFITTAAASCCASCCCSSVKSTNAEAHA
jgi:cytochrome c oxidase cbb3-type subunit 1